MARAEDRYDSLIKYYAEEYKFRFPWEFVKALIKVESGFDPRAESKAGAKGLAQFMDKTWEEWGQGDPFNPEESIKACIKYLNWLHEQWKGKVKPEFLSQFILASYNWGIGKVQELWEKCKKDERLFLQKIPKSVKHYLAAVRVFYNTYRRLGRWTAR